MRNLGLFKDNEKIILQIGDNGVQNNMRLKEQSYGLGLKNIQSRVSKLGGTLEMDNSDGMVLNVILPFK